MEPHFSVIDTEYGAAKGTLTTYITGFILSLVLTLIPYFIVLDHLIANQKVELGVIVIFGIAQLLVQLIFFLHLSSKSRARWNTTVFGFALLVIVLLVGGSLWIMTNLNYNMMLSPAQLDKQIMQDEGMTGMDGMQQ